MSTSKRGIHHERALRIAQLWRNRARLIRKSSSAWNIMPETRKMYERDARVLEKLTRELYREVISE